MRDLVVVQCRRGSTRLPDKALLPFGGETSMLTFLLRRLICNLQGASFLVLATTMLVEDDATARIASKLGVPAVRGEVDDVLARYGRCLDAFPADCVVRVTADNPLTDPYAVACAVDAIRAGGTQYADALTHWPVGLGVDAFSADCIETLCCEAILDNEREHLNARILAYPGRFSSVRVRPERTFPKTAFRFTIDTPADYARVGRLVDSCAGTSETITAEQAIHAASRKALP